MEVRGQLHSPAALPLWGVSSRYPLDRKLVGSTASLEAVAKRKNLIIAPCRESSPGRPTRSLVCILTELPLCKNELRKLHNEDLVLFIYAQG